MYFVTLYGFRNFFQNKMNFKLYIRIKQLFLTEYLCIKNLYTLIAPMLEDVVTVTEYRL